MRWSPGTVLVAATLLLASVLWVEAGWTQTKVLRVGVLSIDAPTEWMVPFRQALHQHGWIEGKNLAFEFRHAGGNPSRISEGAAELVALELDVLFPVGPPSVRAAFATTRTVPIVAHDLETDPVAAGYAQSYAHPGGNLTGLFLDSPDLAGKWVELLKTIMPRLSRVAVLWDSSSGPVPLQAVRSVAPSMGIKLQVVQINTSEDINKAPSAFRGRPQALIILPSPMMYFESARLAMLTKRLRLPATSMFVAFADAGGMLAYGPELAATMERCAQLVAKILDGAKPGDLPIERPSKFEFVLNLKTAKDLHLAVPDTVRLRADKLIN